MVRTENPTRAHDQMAFWQHLSNQFFRGNLAGRIDAQGTSRLGFTPGLSTVVENMLGRKKDERGVYSRQLQGDMADAVHIDGSALVALALSSIHMRQGGREKTNIRLMLADQAGDSRAIPQVQWSQIWDEVTSIGAQAGSLAPGSRKRRAPTCPEAPITRLFIGVSSSSRRECVR